MGKKRTTSFIYEVPQRNTGEVETPEIFSEHDAFYEKNNNKKKQNKLKYILTHMGQGWSFGNMWSEH